MATPRNPGQTAHPKISGAARTPGLARATGASTLPGTGRSAGLPAAVGSPARRAPQVAGPLKRQRQRSARRFALRVFVLLSLIGGVAYAAWFAPWSRHATPVRYEVAP